MKKKILLSTVVISMLVITLPFSSFATTSKSKASKYSSLFTEKWYKPLQKEYRNIYDDYNLYPDETEREIHWVYDGLVDEFRKTRKDAPKRTTKHAVEGELFVAEDFWYYHDGRFIIKDKESFLNNEMKKYIFDANNDFYSFEEFESKCKNRSTNWYSNYDCMDDRAELILKYTDLAFFPRLNTQIKIIATTSFKKLSGAMKIYALDKSRYFDCRENRKTKYDKYGMIYKTSKSGTTDKLSKTSRLKNLYKNKATGVCHDYSNYEKTYFSSVGIKAWYRSSNKIEHAWTVVKVKNSKGKTLWIPFDYGIGPAENLSVSKKQKAYIDTESKRYKLYLKGISGAPKYKNFTDSDFN